jgi:hypothetical protein
LCLCFWMEIGFHFLECGRSCLSMENTCERVHGG